MNLTRDQLLSRAAVSQDKHSHVCGRHPFHYLEHRFHGRALAHHDAKAPVPAQFFLENPVLFAQPVALARIFYQQTQLIHFKRLGEVFISPGANRLDGDPFRSVRGDNDDGRRFSPRRQLLQKADPGSVGEIDIQQHQCRLLPFYEKSGGSQVRRFKNHVFFDLQCLPDSIPGGFLVVYYKNLVFHRR